MNHFMNLVLEHRREGSRRGTVAGGALLVVALLATGVPFAARSWGQGGGEVARVMALETLWNQAEVDKDLRALGQIVPDTFMYVNTDGKLNTKAEFLEDIKNGTDKPSEIRNESMLAHAYGSTVVVITGIYREKGTSGGKRYARRGRFTDTWVNQEGTWQCVASQSTLIEK